MSAAPISSPQSPRTTGPPWELLLATIVAFLPVAVGAHIFVPDDVYFYLKIAREIVDGNGSTFNGLVPTNGYHPLWMLVCIVERLIVGTDRIALIRLHLVVSGLLNLVAILATHRLARRLGLQGFVAAGLVAFYLAYNALGSEIHASAPLVLLAAILLARGARSTRDLAILGTVLGFAMLARLDNVFVAASLTVAAAWAAGSTGLGGFVRRGLAIGIPASAVVAPYLAWNWITFGHFVPISGAIKAGLAAETLHPRLGAQTVLLMAGSIVSCVLAWRRTRGAGRDAWLALSAGALLHAGYVMLRMENVWTWYFTSELVATALVAETIAAWLAARLAPGRRWPQEALRVAAVAPLLLVAWLQFAHLRGGQERWFLDLARWMDANLPEHAAVAATCSPGSVGYFSEHPVLALDGLTGDYAFHERAAADGLSKTLADLGVRYIYAFGPRSEEVTRFARVTERRGHGGEGIGFYATPLGSGESELHAISVFSPILGRSLGSICLEPEELVGQGFPGRRMGVWRLPPDGGCRGGPKS